MKRILLLFGFFVITTTGLYAQVGIGTRDPHPTAQLEVKATNKGVLIPRVVLKATKNQSPIVGTMTNSLLVYNTVTNTVTTGQEVYPGYYFWYQGAWNRVVSQEDFSNTNITKNILKGSNIVTYNSKSNTLNYYTEDGTQTSVNIVNAINNYTGTETIEITKIKPSTTVNKILATVTKTVNGKVVTVTEWRDPKTFDSKASELTAGNGIKILKDGTTTVTSINGVLTPFTLKVDDLDLSALKGTPGVDGRIITVDKDGNVTTTETIKVNNVKGDRGDAGKILTVGTDGVVTYTNKIDASKIERSNLTSTTDSGVKITNGDGVVLGENDVTITVDGLDISKVNVGGNKGDIMIVGTNSKVTYTSTISADKIQSGTLSSNDGSVQVSDGAGVVLKNVNITVGEVNVDKLKVDTAANDGDILVVDKSSGNNSITYTSTTNFIDNKITKGNLTGGEGVTITTGEGRLLGGNATISVENLPVTKIAKGANGQVITTDGTTVKWGKLSGDNITGKKLTGTNGIKVDAEDNLALLQSVTLSVDNLPVTSINPAGGDDKLLTVKGGNVTWTSNLPEGTTVSVTNIKGGTAGTSGTSTRVVVLDNSGNATTTTIKELVSNTVTVGNGLSKESDGKIVLGGNLENAVTTITTAEDKKLAITGLTNTDTTTDDDKVMVLGKDNVMKTVSATAFKGSGNYVVTNRYSVATDEKTGNTFNDGTKSYPEKIRTVEVELTKESANYLSSEKLKLDGYDLDKILVTEVKIFSKGKIKTTGTEKRSVTFSAANYTIESNSGIVEPGISSGGFSAPIYKGTYYVTIKYIDKN